MFAIYEIRSVYGNRIKGDVESVWVQIQSCQLLGERVEVEMNEGERNEDETRDK